MNRTVTTHLFSLPSPSKIDLVNLSTASTFLGNGCLSSLEDTACILLRYIHHTTSHEKAPSQPNHPTLRKLQRGSLGLQRPLPRLPKRSKLHTNRKQRLRQGTARNMPLIPIRLAADNRSRECRHPLSGLQRSPLQWIVLGPHRKPGNVQLAARLGLRRHMLQLSGTAGRVSRGAVLAR